jgi:hypothetical protein
MSALPGEADLGSETVNRRSWSKPALRGTGRSFNSRARNHRNLPMDILVLFSSGIIQPFDTAA